MTFLAEAGALETPPPARLGEPGHGPTDGKHPSAEYPPAVCPCAGRKHAIRRLHGAQHYYTPCKRISGKRSDVVSVASCWPEAGRVTPILSTNAPVAGPTIPCGPRAPTPSRTTAIRSVNMTDKAAPKLPGANGFKYREQFGVIVICKDEAEHKAVYERLRIQRLWYGGSTPPSRTMNDISGLHLRSSHFGGQNLHQICTKLF